MNAVNKKKKYVEPACFSIAMTLHTNKNISTIPSTDFYGFFFFSVDLGKVFWRGEKKKIKTKQAWIFLGIVYIGGNHSRNITIANIDITC